MSTRLSKVLWIWALEVSYYLVMGIFSNSKFQYNIENSLVVCYDCKQHKATKIGHFLAHFYKIDEEIVTKSGANFWAPLCWMCTNISALVQILIEFQHWLYNKICLTCIHTTFHAVQRSQNNLFHVLMNKHFLNPAIVFSLLCFGNVPLCDNWQANRWIF